MSLRPSLAGALCAAVAALAIAGSVGPRPAAGAPALVASASDDLSTFVAELNVVRAQNGLPPMIASSALSELALEHTQDMISQGYFAHDAPGPPFQQRAASLLDLEGWQNWNATENILFRAGVATPDQLLADWLSSPEHRANLLARDTPFIGLGAVTVDSAAGFFDELGQVTVATSIQAGQPQPELGQTVLATALTGVVLVRRPGSTAFSPLNGTQLIGSGSLLDGSRGRVRIASVADEAAHVEAADVSRGRFAVSYTNTAHQAAQAQVLTELALSRPGPQCAKPPGKKPKPAAAGCSSATVQVVQGSFDVYDLASGRHVLLSAGQTYPARAG